MARISDQNGRSFAELFRMVQCLLHMNEPDTILNANAEDQDIVVIDSGYCLDRIANVTHTYPRRK